MCFRRVNAFLSGWVASLPLSSLSLGLAEGCTCASSAASNWPIFVTGPCLSGLEGPNSTPPSLLFLFAITVAVCP